MKQIKLLLAAMAAMVGLSAYAQSWTASEVGAGKYVIYNVGSGQYLTAGNAYGTQASITTTGVSSATHVELIANGDNFFIRTGVGSANYGMENLAAAGAVYMDQSRNKQATWTFTQVSTDNGPVYNIISADNHGGGSGAYLTANEGNTVVSDNGTASSAYAQWKLLPEAQIPLVAAIDEYTNVRATVLGFKNNTSAYTDEAGAATTLQSAIDTQDAVVTAATTVEEVNNAKAALSAAGNTFLSSIIITSGFDITNVWITNAAPGINGNLNGWTNSGSPTLQAQLYEYWQVSAGTTKQTLKDLPKGAYTLTAIAYTRDGMTATLYAGENTVKLVGCGSVNDRNGGSTWIAAGNGVNTLNFTLDEATESLEIGLIADNTTGDHWMCWRSFSLTYYGDPINLAKVNLAEAVAAAKAYEGHIPNVAYEPISAAVNANDKAYDTVEEYNAAVAAINAAVAQNASAALAASYSRYLAVKANALAIVPNTDVTAADEAVNAATTTEAVEAAIVTLRAAFMAELPKVSIAEGSYLDVTNVLVDNPSVSANTDFWTSELNGSDKTGGSWAVVNYGETEFYNNNFKFYQTLALIPGTWEFGVTGFHRAGNHSTYFYAGEDKILIPGVANTVVNTMAQAKTYFDNGNGKVALKFLIETAGDVEIGIDNKDTQTDKWTIFRDFTLKYYGAPDYSIYETQWSEAVAAADAALATYADVDGFAATEKTDLTTAKGNVPTPEGLKAGYLAKIQALTDATAAYVVKAQKYQSAKDAIAKANAIKEAHNFASAEAIATFSDAVKAISDKYDDLSLTQEEAAAAAANLGVAVTGWHAGNNTPAAVYMRDGFALGDFDADLHVNTWSVEGDTDGSGFSVPFYEYWIEDAYSLGEKTWTGTLTGLENGLYEVSAWVRVRAKNGVAAADATGITMDVNGGGEGDYAAVDVTEGAQIGESQFQIQTYTAQNLVKDGNLTLNFNIAADNNISWLSFKNVKYTKVRDLTPEEAFTPATAEDYQALAEAIAAKKIGFDEGEYAPYNNIEAIAALKAAQVIDPEASNSQEDVQAATQAISDATWTVNETEVNAIWDASFQHDYSGQTGNVNPIGWQRVKGAEADGYNVRYMGGNNAGLAATTSGKALFTKNSAFYGYADGYSMPLKAETYYKVSFIYGGWGDCKKDGYVTMLAPDGSDIELSASDLPLDAIDADSNKDSWKSYAAIFKTGEAGDYVLGLRKKNEAVQSQYVYGDIQIVRATAADLKAGFQQAIDDAQAEKAKYIVGEDLFMYPESEMAPLTNAIATATVALNDGEATAESIIAARETLLAAVENFAPTANQPDAEKAYTFQLRLDGETPLYMNLTESGITIAETATALKFVVAEVAGQFYLATDAGEPLYVGLAGTNAWSMSTAAEKKAAWTFSALGDNAYRINNLTTAGCFVGTNAADKAAGSSCYADKLTSNGNVDWIITEYKPIPTGVAGIKTDDRKSVIYDLSGRKVEKMVKGVYIINGKKVTVK